MLILSLTNITFFPNSVREATTEGLSELRTDAKFRVCTPNPR